MYIYITRLCSFHVSIILFIPIVTLRLFDRSFFFFYISLSLMTFEKKKEGKKITKHFEALLTYFNFPYF